MQKWLKFYILLVRNMTKTKMNENLEAPHFPRRVVENKWAYLCIYK